MTEPTPPKSGIGTHAGHITKAAAEPIPQKYLLGKFAADPDAVGICGAGDLPIGVITDEAPASPGEKSFVDVALLGGADTLLGVAAAPIVAGDILVATAGGRVQKLPTTSGTYQIVGIALTAATVADRLVEFVGCVPQQRVIPSGG
jgi:hypothetical protein